MGLFSSDEETVEVPEKQDPNAWEFLDDTEDFGTWRRMVPGGWLVRVREDVYHGGGEALCFLPDPDHKWRPK